MTTTRVCVLTANLVTPPFDPLVPYAGQDLPPSVEMTRIVFTDSNFPPRTKSMTPRLQARIPKMFGWQMCPGFDVYIWVDASCALLHKDSVRWFLEQLGNYDIAVFQHPDRRSISEEAQFLFTKLEKNNKYLVPRYKGEDLIGQMAEIKLDVDFEDRSLYASTAFIYRNTFAVRNVLKEWWYHTSRYHSIDQLSLPYVLWRHNINVIVIEQNYLKCPYITYTRNQRGG